MPEMHGATKLRSLTYEELLAEGLIRQPKKSQGTEVDPVALRRVLNALHSVSKKDREEGRVAIIPWGRVRELIPDDATRSACVALLHKAEGPCAPFSVVCITGEANEAGAFALAADHGMIPRGTGGVLGLFDKLVEAAKSGKAAVTFTPMERPAGMTTAG